MWKLPTSLGAVFNGFCAALLVYVVVGTLLGFALARPYSMKDWSQPRDCWPVTNGLDVWSNCDSQAAEALWHGTVGLPRQGMAFPVVLLWALKIPPTHSTGHDAGYQSFVTLYGLATAIFALLTVAGFLVWRRRTTIVAWALLLGWVVEIALSSSTWMRP